MSSNQETTIQFAWLLLGEEEKQLADVSCKQLPESIHNPYISLSKYTLGSKNLKQILTTPYSLLSQSNNIEAF